MLPLFAVLKHPSSVVYYVPDVTVAGRIGIATLTSESDS